MKILKNLWKVVSGVLTAASLVVMILALCAIDIKELSWTPFIVFFTAYAWLVCAARRIGRKENAK